MQGALWGKEGGTGGVLAKHCMGVNTMGYLGVQEKMGCYCWKVIR